MKALLTLAAAIIAAPLAANPAVAHLAGVSDTETTIPYGAVQQVERGHGDVLFVRDRTNQWYRLGLNHGCLRGVTVQLDQVVVDHKAPTTGIDRFTVVRLPRNLASCAIVSIRASAPPPQVDSHSRVTLD
jgi:hypothetical protein